MKEELTIGSKANREKAIDLINAAILLRILQIMALNKPSCPGDCAVAQRRGFKSWAGLEAAFILCGSEVA